MRGILRRLGGLYVVALLAALMVGALPLPVLVPESHAQACPDLIVNGGFETGDAWLLGPSPVMPQYVSYAKHTGNRSLLLGITSGANVESYSSARQTVVLPPGTGPLTLSFWAYTMADSPATTDYMEVVLLNATGTAIINKPWQSHNDARLWNLYTFDLTAWRGQTVQVYFNVYNDGVGGRAAMLLDDVTLTDCAAPVTTGTPTSTPTGTITITATPTGTIVPTVTPTPTGTVPPPCTNNLITNGGFDAGLAGWQQIGSGSSIVSPPEPVHTPPNALQLGSLTQNLVGESSVRQLVTIPTGYSQVTLDVWVYEVSQDVTNADYQRIDLLNSSGGPWLQLSYGTSNNAAWRQLVFDLTPFSGNTAFVSFAVNNDGVAGRTAMYVDDVRLRGCNPGPATPTPTVTLTTAPAGATATPTRTATPPATPSPITPPPSEGCTQLITNNGFETGVYPWMPGKNELPAQVVTAPDPSGAFAVALGALNDNRYSYSSIRQWVTIPAGQPRVIVSFWAYTRAESLWGQDRQEFVVLGAGDAVLTVPWKVLENEQVWRQRVFDVFGVAGQTIGIYFNVINDGLGGRTSMFLDEVYAWACTPGAFPANLTPGGAPGTTAFAAGVTAAQIPLTPTPGTTSETTTAGVTGIGPEEAIVVTATPTPMSTRVALDVPTQIFAGQVVASETPSGGSSVGAMPTPKVEASGPLVDIVRNWRQGWQWVVLAIVLLLVAILIIAYLRSR